METWVGVSEWHIWQLLLPDSPEPSGVTKEAHSLILEVVILPNLLEDHLETSDEADISKNVSEGPHGHPQVWWFARQAHRTQHMVLLMTVIYYSSRIQSKISKGNRAWRDPKEAGKSFSRSSVGIGFQRRTENSRKELRPWFMSYNTTSTFLFQTRHMIIPGSME